MKQLETDVAIKACQESGNIPNLLRLHEMEKIEEQLLLVGHASKFTKDYNHAYVIDNIWHPLRFNFDDVAFFYYN